MIAADSIFCGAAPFVGNWMQFNQKRREFIMRRARFRLSAGRHVQQGGARRSRVDKAGVNTMPQAVLGAAASRPT